MSGPFYGCDFEDCSSEMTYPASDLYIYEGTVWCEGCLENDVGRDAFDHTTAFVPPDDVRIMALEAKNRLQAKSIDSQRFVLKQLRDYIAKLETVCHNIMKIYNNTHELHQWCQDALRKKP